MSAIYGVLGINDTDRVFLNTLGQRVIFDAVVETLRIHNEELTAMLGAFVDQTTSDFKFRYKLPGGGRLQRRGGQAQSGAVKAIGQWDVAFPLEEWGDQIAGDRISYAYATIQELNRNLDTIQARNINTVRHELLYALFHGAAWTFDDELNGDLTIQPLAAGESGVLYPPVEGSESEATEDHYLESGYTAANISDTNDPVQTIADDIDHHPGLGGGEKVVFINRAQKAKVAALSDYYPVLSSNAQRASTDQIAAGDGPSVPGEIIGWHEGAGAWISQWSGIPSGWMFGLSTSAPPPLVMRVDPEYTNLPRGLAMVAESDREPFSQSHYSHRFGFGVGNRLNGVAMELSADADDYDAPSAYA